MPEHKARVDTARHLRAASTESEALLWEALRGRGLGHAFRRQHVLGPFVADLYCPAVRLVVEVDGAVHRGQEEQDRFRESLIRQHSIEFVRFTAGEVEADPESVAAEVLSAVTERGRHITYHARWVPAHSLVVGDIVLCDNDAGQARVEAVELAGVVDAVLYDLAVAHDGSYATCACFLRGAPTDV